MELAHYTDGKHDVVWEMFDYDQNIDFSPVFKPRGLWVSTEGPQGDDDELYGWREWCINEDFGVDRLRHRYVVELADDANILTMSTSRELDDFTDEYATVDPLYADFSPRILGMHKPDWGKVAEKYDGVIISPYIWGSRTAYLWYNGWDCASGCIWRMRAIKSIERDRNYSLSDVLANSPER